MSRIYLLTPGQPSTDPRLVKEVDMLTEAGHDVRWMRLTGDCEEPELEVRLPGQWHPDHAILAYLGTLRHHPAIARRARTK